MPDLMPRVSEALYAPRNGAGLIPQTPRRVQRAVDAEIGQSLVRAAGVLVDTHVSDLRVAGASMVAEFGMHRVAELHRRAMRHLEETPTRAAADNFQAITDVLTAVVVNEVVKIGRGR
jgi:hypothetical protein